MSSWDSGWHRQIQEEPSAAHLHPGLVKATSSASWPRHADSPTSASSCSSVAPGAEVREAVGFMHRFLQENSQDLSQKIRFLDCVDIINVSFSKERNVGLVSQIYNPSLMRETLKYLLPGASSPVAQEREMTLSRITKLISCITGQCVTRGMKDFKIGQLVGTLTLCCCDPSEEVSHWAADGLHHLYTLILTQKGMIMTDDKQEYLELLKEWEEEKIFWLAWFSDVSEATRIFKKCLRTEDQTDFILTAIRAMKDESAHRTPAATQMLKRMLQEPVPNLVKTTKAVKVIYLSLESIKDAQAHQELHRYLRLLGNSHPPEVAKTLLGCSLQCDSSASTMWHVLMSSSETAQKILMELQTVLQERPLSSDDPWNKATLSPLAANAALHEIVKHSSPACKEVLKAMYPTLSIALLCQISYTVHFTPQEIDVYWRTCIQQQFPTPLIPFRAVLRTFKALLKHASGGDQVLIMNKRRGSEFLLHRATHQRGIALFARALIRNQGCGSILPYLLDILDNKEDAKHTTVMTFLVELLRQQTFDEATEERIIRQLCKQLTASRYELRSLALDGMLYLTSQQDKIIKLGSALPDILARLKEANREVNVKALRLLPYLLKCQQSDEASALTLEVATRVIPLFDDASNKVRLAAISTFNCLFETVKKAEKEQMKELVFQSLVSLMVHLHDESVPVTQACWDALRRGDGFLKSFIQIPIHEYEAWSFCTSLVKRYKDQGERLLVDQAFSYLENPRQALREAAIKLLEILAQETKSRETISAIATVLNLAKLHRRPPNIYLAASEILGTVRHDAAPEGVVGRCFSRFRMMYRRCRR